MAGTRPWKTGRAGLAVALVKSVLCVVVESPKIPSCAKTAKTVEAIDMNLHMELSAHRPVPTEVEGEPLSEAEQHQSWIDFEEKRYFRLVLTLGGETQVLHSPAFLKTDTRQAGDALRHLLAATQASVLDKIPGLLT